MFRIHRNKPDKSSGERIDFKFSNFQILQVPKEWDKLVVSIVSVETGKTVTKSGKGLVRNGKCIWKESLSESIWILREDTSKEIEDNLFKLVVSMGSLRSGILGEATINLTTYISSKSAVPVSLPLKKNNHGTILQVKIHCLNPKATARDEQWQETTSRLENMSADYDETDNKSDISDNSNARSVGSSSSTHLGSSSHPGEVGSRNTSFSVSGSRHSSDSAEGFIDKTRFSPRHHFTGDLDSPIARHDSSASPNSATHEMGPAEEFSPSNHSSFNSRFTGSGVNLHSQRLDLGHNISGSLAMSSLRNTSSSKELLEAAEDTVEDLRAEAKMWERNARKVMLDLELLRKESTDHSRNRADLKTELSASCTERDGLKQEIQQLKKMLEESKLKQIASEYSISQAEGITHIQKELESELKFQQDSNTNLAVQFKKTQESNIELVSILQELEETIEKQMLEIDILSAEKEKISIPENCGHRNDGTPLLGPEEMENVELNLRELKDSEKDFQAKLQLVESTLQDKNKELELEKNMRNKALLELEAGYKAKLFTKEQEIIKLEVKLSDIFRTQGSNEKFSGGDDSHLINEIEALKEKVQELETDCNELTEENLDLILKLRDSGKDPRAGGDSFNSSSSELLSTVSATASESEVDLLRSEIYQLKQELKKKNISEGVSSCHLEVQLVDLQSSITDLVHQLRSSQDKACDLDSQLHNSQVEMEERGMEITVLKQQLKSYQEKHTNNELHQNLSEQILEKSESHSSAEMSETFSKLYSHLQVALTHVKRPWCKGSSRATANYVMDHNDLVHSNHTDAITQELLAEDILKNFSEMNELLEAKILECETAFQYIEAELREKCPDYIRDQDKLENDGLDEKALNHSIQELENLKTELEAKVNDLSKDLFGKGTQMNELEGSLLLKKEEIEVLRHSLEEMEAQISDLQNEKTQLEENFKVVSRGSSVTSKCLDDVRSDMMVLTSSLDSHVSANKILERKSSELESGKGELELHLLELEEENVQLSERLSGMEAQLRCLTDDKESSRLEIDNSKSLAKDLHSEIKRIETEMEIQKVDLKHKLQDMQKRWSEAQEECEYLKRANPKLQATAESFIEECDSMQKLNGELRKQKLELHEHCTHVEAKLTESQNNFNDWLKKIEVLESKFSSMEEDINSKEKILTSELDSLLHENTEHEEKLILEESLLGQMYMEKAVEVESLQREVAHLTEQISKTHDEREKIASNAVLEVSILRDDKAKIENTLQEAQAKVKLYDSKLQILQLESETKVHGMINELSSYRQNQDLMMADRDKLQRLLDEVKHSEEKFKSTVNMLELKLTTSEYERQLLVEELASLKVHLQKVEQLQDEVVALNNSLNAVKFEKGKLEASLQLVSGDCEELKAEKISYLEKISSLQKIVSELDDCKCCRVALEEKLLQLEGDLTAKQALCVQDAELKNELNRIKRSNSQFQPRLQCLEEEKDEWLKRAQILEEELPLKKEEKQHQSKSIDFESGTRVDLPHEKLRHSENEMEKDSCAENGRISMKTKDNVQYPKEGDNNHECHNESIGDDFVAKIQLLENELAEAVEANSMYKAQLKKLLTDGQNGYANGPKESTVVEAELKDICERYFHMSLKFAEVEAEREKLVMQIKTLKNGRRWFS